MRQIFTALNAALVHNVKNVLEAQGIACHIRGENLLLGVGEIPPVECWAELWVVDDSRFDEAKAILADVNAPNGDSWTCAKCGETVGAEFGECWGCQTAR